MDRKQLVALLAVLIVWRFLQQAPREQSLGLSLVVFVAGLAIFVVAITLHEFGHAIVATWLGDPTPRAAGRVTLNPLAHLHPIGTLLILAANFGFATPVPINPRYFKRPERDQLLVAMAGPGMNLLLCGLAILGARTMIDGVTGLQYFAWPHWKILTLQILEQSAVMNAILAIFNLFPIPPLDGSYLAERILPPRQRFWFRQHQSAIAMIALVLLMLHAFDPLFSLVGKEVRRLCLS